MDKIKEKPQTVSSIHEKIKAAPKELVHRGLEDGSDRLRTGLRDAAQQGQRDDYGGDQIEDPPQAVFAAWSAVRKNSSKRGGRTSPPAAAPLQIQLPWIPRRRSAHRIGKVDIAP